MESTFWGLEKDISCRTLPHLKIFIEISRGYRVFGALPYMIFNCYIYVASV